MVKDIVKRIILSIILNFVWFVLLPVWDALTYWSDIINYLFAYHEDACRTFLFYVVVSLQVLIWIYPPIKNKKLTVLFLSISLACTTYIFGYLAV